MEVPTKIEAEQACLGSLLIDPDLVPDAIDLLALEDFYREAHAVIFKAILELYDADQAADVVLVSTRLESQGELEVIGGAAYLTQLVNSTPTSTHFVHYASQVVEAANRRRIMSLSSELVGLAQDGSFDVGEILAQGHDMLIGIGERVQTQRPAVDFREALAQYWKRVGKEQEGEILSVPFGFRDLDGKVGGLLPGDLCYVAGRPSTSKTTLVLQMACNNARLGMYPGVLFSVESTQEELAGRVLGYMTNVFSDSVRKGLVPQDKVEWAQKMGESWAFPFFVRESYDLTPQVLDAALSKLTRKHEIRFVIVDYLHSMRTTRRADSRLEEQEEVSRRLKGLAVKYKVPVIAVSQLRKVEVGGKRRPTLADLMGSSALAYDADVVLILHWSGQVEEDSPRRYLLEVDVAKNREGPRGRVYLARYGQGQLGDLRAER